MSSVPDPSLVWLVGPSGSGKSTWAAEHFRDVEVVSSDHLRSIVGSGPNDLDASGAAFELLERIATARISAGLLTVVDTLGFDDELRTRLADLAEEADLPRIAVLFDTPEEVCRERNRTRDRSVPARVLTGQFKRYRAVREQMEESGWRVIHPDAVQVAIRQAFAPAIETRPERGDSIGSATTLAFHLHISDFDWVDSPDTLTDVLRAAEDAGFSGVSVMDHLIQIPQVGRAWDDMLEPHIVLAHAAAVTQRLRLGVLVTNVTLRPVAVLAKMLATLDVLSGGRVDCGLGAGWFAREQVDRGIAFPEDGDRLDLLTDTIGALRAFWGPGGKPWTGSTLRIADTGMYPRPTQDSIPIIVGGGGERRTLRIVAEHADGCNLFTGAALSDKLAKLAEHCVAFGRDIDDVLVTVLDVTIAADDREHLAGLVERHRANTPARDFRKRTSAGVTDDHVRRYRALREAGVDRVYVSLIDLDGVGPVERFGKIISAV